MEILSDKQIVICIKNGQIDHFSFIVKKYSKQIYGYIYGKLKKRDDAEDIVQEAFFNFYKAISRFDEERPILPYLYKIAKNELKMYFRSRKSTVSLDEAILVEDEADYWEKGDMDKLFAKLSPDQKKAVALVSDGYSYKEISKELGRPINTVRTIIRRARLQLTKYKDYE